MYLKIKKAKLEPDKRGQKIVITMVGLYNDDDKRVKRVKLDEDVLQSFLSTKRDIDAVIDRDTSKETPKSTQPNLL